MDNTIKVTTIFSADEIRQIVTDPQASSVAEAITERIMNLRDEATRKALKELGWISPEERQGMALVPREITAETGHKTGMMSEFSQSIPVRCEACDGDGLGRDEEYGGCDECNGAGEYMLNVNISWTTIKAIHKRIVEIAEGGDHDSR